MTPTDNLANQALNQHQKSFDIAHQAPKMAINRYSHLVHEQSNVIYAFIILLAFKALE